VRYLTLTINYLHAYLVRDAVAQASRIAEYVEWYNVDGDEIGNNVQSIARVSCKCETCYFYGNLVCSLLAHKAANVQ
jgi:hypothetical protein